MELSRISVIGAGNLAAHLVPALASAGISIMEVISRRTERAARLAEPLGIPFHTGLNRINPDSQAVILAVPDDAIEPVLEKIRHTERIMIHTSGSIPMSVFIKHAEACGVFYPLQTFSVERGLDFSTIPVFVEADSPETLAAVRQLAGRISRKVIEAGSDTRRIIHLAAVFACNFPNHLYLIAKLLLQQEKMDFELLAPLIRETTAKALETDPEKAQTGPALRKDRKVLEKHLEMLSSRQQWKDIYQLISENIIRMHPEKEAPEQ